MKIIKQKHIDYDNIGYGENDGWKSMYDWGKMQKIIKRGGIVVSGLSAITALLLFRFVFNSIINTDNKISYLLLVLLSILLYVIIVVPIHEILHLVAYNPNIFTKKHYIFVGLPAVSAFYDGEISKLKALFSSVLPFIGITLGLLVIGIFVNMLMPWISLLIIMNAGGSWTDIFMFFYLSKKIPKNAVVYGNRYKVIEE